MYFEIEMFCDTHKDEQYYDTANCVIFLVAFLNRWDSYSTRADLRLPYLCLCSQPYVLTLPVHKNRLGDLTFHR